jgi:hypothetical protein
MYAEEIYRVFVDHPVVKSRILPIKIVLFGKMCQEELCPSAAAPLNLVSENTVTDSHGILPQND